MTNDYKARFMQEKINEYFDDLDGADIIAAIEAQADFAPVADMIKTRQIDTGVVYEIIKEAVYREAISLAEAKWERDGQDYSAQRQEDHEWAQHFKMPPEFRP